MAYFHNLPVLTGSLAYLLVCMVGALPANAQSVVKILTSPSDAAASPNLQAFVSSSVIAAKVELSGGPVEKSAERQKCIELASVAGPDISGIFQNAVSSFTFSISIAENRTAEGYDKAWSEALRGLSEQGGLKFNIPNNSGFIPVAANVNVKISRPTYLKSLGAPAETFFVHQFENNIQTAVTKQLDTFNKTGIVRATFNDQAAICFALLVRRVELTMDITGRTFDRITLVPILDRDCLTQKLLAINAGFARQQLTLGDLRGKDDFSFFVGLYTTPSQRSFWGMGPTDSRLCGVGRQDEADTPDTIGQWRAMLDRWWSLVQNQNKLELPVSALQQLANLAARQLNTPTGINYQYVLAFDAGDKI